VASGLLALRTLDDTGSGGAQVVAGHSVGEITASTAAGVLTEEQAMVLVRERGRAMAHAAGRTETGMTAVLGGDPDDVTTVLERHGLTTANVNGSGQVVAAGTASQLAALAADPPNRARLRPLSVAGAFHTEHMTPAVDRLRGLAAGMTVRDPGPRLLSNRDGAVVTSGSSMLERLVAQVSTPVRWDMCMQSLVQMGVTGLLELPPAGTLTGLARRGLPGVATFALSNPDQLDDARSFVAEHGEPAAVAHPEPAWRLVVAPIKGTVSTVAHAVGSALSPGAIVGQVRSLRDAWEVVTPHGGRVLEWLVEDGDPVSPGQPLLRLHPTEDSEAAA
jgi:[acyl-carrier-protein] S-malonyltransferase